MKITFLDDSTANKGDLDWGLFDSLGEVTSYELTSPDEVVERISEAEVVVTNKVKMEAKHFEAAPHLKLICLLATGTDIIDLQAAHKLGVTVCNVPDYSSDSVAQSTFALLLELTHAVGDHSRDVQNGEWSRSPSFSFWKQPLIELSGKTMLIVGLGNIGNKVAKIAEAFGMKVLVTSVQGTDHDSSYESVTLDEGLKVADVVSLHCPFNTQTKEMVNANWLTKMKPSAYVINTARGGLVNDQQLANALQENTIAGYAADVLSSEPPATDHPLIGVPRCILTPHYAWASLEARKRLWQVCADNVAAFISGTPQNVIESPH